MQRKKNVHGRKLGRISGLAAEYEATSPLYPQYALCSIFDAVFLAAQGVKAYAILYGYMCNSFVFAFYVDSHKSHLEWHTNAEYLT